MPGRNGTGPRGLGAATGRGMGYCVTDRPAFRGLGGRGYLRMGRGRMDGYGYGFRFRGAYPAEYEVDDLRSYRRYLEEELKYLNSQLDKEE
jgi:hypothetical protein